MLDNKATFLKWAIVVSLIVAVCGLAVLALIETNIDYQQGWLSYVVVLVIYLPIQIVVEGVLAVYWESPKWVVRTAQLF